MNRMLLEMMKTMAKHDFAAALVIGAIVGTAVTTHASSREIAAAHQSIKGTATFYYDQPSFENGLYDPGALVEENFDEVPDLFESCDEPVNSQSDDRCFKPGQLIGGFDLTSTSGEGIVLLPAGYFGENETSSAMGAIAFADSTFLTLSPPVTAVSTMVYGELIQASGTTVDIVDIEIFDSNGASLGSMSVSPVQIDQAAFLGVVSQTPISRIAYTAQQGGSELIDTLRFGHAERVPDNVFCDGFDLSPSICSATQ